MTGVVELRDGRQVAWGECGARDGRPVLYLHGAPGSVVEGADSLYSAEFARAGVRFIAMERAGYGVSTPQQDRRFMDIAVDVRGLADRLDLGRFGVVGWSTGGPHALAAAVGLPDRVRAVGALASIAPLDKVGLDGLGLRIFIDMGQSDPDGLREQMKQLAVAMRADPEATSNALLAEVMSERDAAYFASPENRGVVLADLVESARGDWAGYADDCLADGRDWGFDLADVQAPVLLVHGTADGIVPVEHSRYLTKALPNASLHEASDGGHISVLTHLPALTAEVASFLREG